MAPITTFVGSGLYVWDFFRLAPGRFAGFFGSLLVMLSPSLWAWGGQGHQALAQVAWQRLTPQARAGVGKLLALEPGQTLARSPVGPTPFATR